MGEYVYVYNEGTENRLSFYVTLGATVTFTVEQIYIGNGSYNTPIIDNANGEWNSTSQSGVAVQGVSGKGLKCFANNVVIQSFNLMNNFSLSIWIKPDNATTNLQGLLLIKNSSFYVQNGINGNNNLVLAFYQNGTQETKSIGALLPANEWTHLVITKNGTSLKVYKNGLNTNTFTVLDIPFDQNNNNLNIHSTSATRPQSYDDLLIFNRALSQEEVTALYLNKANTPKYYSWADWRLSQL